MLRAADAADARALATRQVLGERHVRLGVRAVGLRQHTRRHPEHRHARLQRDEEDLFLTEIAAFREEEARLKALTLDLSGVNLVEIDQEAVAPLRPIKPRKALAIALGLVLGAMLGVFAALIRALYQQRQASGPTPPTAVSVPQATP